MSTVLNVTLIVLAVAAIWLVVELVLTVRSARPVMSSLKKAADGLGPVVEKAGSVLDQVQPVIGRLDETLSQAQPAVVQVEPLLVRAAGAIGALSDDLQRLDGILGDVSRATNMAGNAANAVSDAAGSLATRARGIFSRGKGAGRASIAPSSAQGETAVDAQAQACTQDDEVPLEAVPEMGQTRKEPGFFTYPQA